jgi:FkbM family methyltransferase
MRRPRPRYVYRLATNPRARERWQRERLLDAAAAKGIDAIGIRDDRGHTYYIDPRDAIIGRLIFVEGSYEAAVFDRAAAVLDMHPDQILDIGANIGTATVELLDRFHGARAVAFEPDKRNCRLLAQTLVANDLRDRVTIIPVALSDADGFVELEVSADNFGDHRVRATTEPGRFAEHDRPTRSIPARRLETMIRSGELELGNRVLTCLDAQGHEGHILAGGPVLLKHPLIVEFWPYGLRRAGGYDRFLEAIEASTIVVLDGTQRTTTVGDLHAMGLGDGHTDLLIHP